MKKPSLKPHDGDHERAKACPVCGSVSVPLNKEPDITFCLKWDCGADIP